MRAKAKSSSTPYPIWVEGEYITEPPIRPSDGAVRPAGHYIDKGGYPGANVYEVDINTMCRQTDAADRFGKPIYEQDILLYETAEEIGYFIVQDLPNGATYIGTIHEIAMDIYTYNEWYLDNWTNKEEPEDKPLLPANIVVLLSTEANYSMYYGAVGVTDEAGKTIEVVEGSRIPEQWVERRPPRRFLQLNSAPLCVPHEVDSWYVATVC